MALDARTTCFDAQLLRGLVGTTVTTYELDSDGAFSDSISLTLSTQPFHATNSPTTPSALAGSPMTVMTASSGISRTWVITEKLSERAAPLTDHDVKMGRRSAKTVGKFLCHLAEDPNQRAFMRIYQQIPITGTEDADSDMLARQAVLPGVCGELESFKLLRAGRCNAVPRFLGYAESTQGDNNPLPGGYIRYLVWEKVPGEPLTKDFFWSLDDTARREIRSKFRVAFNPQVIFTFRGSEGHGQFSVNLNGQRFVTPSMDWRSQAKKATGTSTRQNGSGISSVVSFNQVLFESLQWE
ncbi:hypothetical protein F1880_000662 [Penicillium rolfsii]|nr:hypothetical protein F1880_000662 [Penicillium rolfsii]